MTSCESISYAVPAVAKSATFPSLQHSVLGREPAGTAPSAQSMRIAISRVPSAFAQDSPPVGRLPDALATSQGTGTLKGLSGHRHRARWAMAGVEASLPLFEALPQTAGEDVLADYAAIGMTLGQHPLRLIRRQLKAQRCTSSADLATTSHGRRVRFAGLVRMRQRPETTSGVTFITFEDEHGMVNAVVWQRTAEAQRRALLESQLMLIDGRLERVDGVQHLIVERMENQDALLANLRTGSQNFR